MGCKSCGKARRRFKDVIADRAERMAISSEEHMEKLIPPSNLNADGVAVWMKEQREKDPRFIKMKKWQERQARIAKRQARIKARNERAGKA